jgi:trigger factor
LVYYQKKRKNVAISNEITRLEPSSVKLAITVGKDDVRSRYDELLAEYSKNLQLPGFRKGKVPKDVLERKFGPSLKGEALGRIIEKSMAEVFEDESFSPKDQPLPYFPPRLDGEPTLDLDADLRFSVTYDVWPDVKVAAWKGLEVEVPDAAVTGEDISRELETLRDRNAIVQDKDDGEAAVKDDVVTVDYRELSEEGEVKEGTERDDFVFTLGTGYNRYKFDDDVAGMKKGETKEILKTYSEEIADRDLAGKTIKLRITLTALKKKILPELDDDLAQDVDEKFKTLDDLKASIRERLTKTLDNHLRSVTVNTLLEKIRENTPVDIPESMIRHRTETELQNQARQYQISLEDFMKILGRSGRSLEDISAEIRPGLIKTIHGQLILTALMEETGFAASDEELAEELEKVAEEIGMPLEEMKKYYEQDEAQAELKDEIKTKKLFDMMLAENTIKKGKQANYLDIVK